MSNFTKLFNVIMEDLANSAGAAFGPAATGNYGNQFPSQNDMAYAPGDARWPFGKESFVTANKKRVKKGKKRNAMKTPKVRIQRRNLS